MGVSYKKGEDIMRKFICMCLVISTICLNFSTIIFAEGDEVLKKFKEYNNSKISLYMSAVNYIILVLVWI